MSVSSAFIFIAFIKSVYRFLASPVLLLSANGRELVCPEKGTRKVLKVVRNMEERNQIGSFTGFSTRTGPLEDLHHDDDNLEAAMTS